VSADHRGIPLGQPASHVRAELGRDRAALVADRAGQVHLQVGLAQALARPVGQGRDAVCGQPEQRGHVGGPGALDLGVPEHGLPAFG
jgi:hypothetical protein